MVICKRMLLSMSSGQEAEYKKTALSLTSCLASGENKMRIRVVTAFTSNPVTVSTFGAIDSGTLLTNQFQNRCIKGSSKVVPEEEYLCCPRRTNWASERTGSLWKPNIEKVTSWTTWKRTSADTRHSGSLASHLLQLSLSIGDLKARGKKMKETSGAQPVRDWTLFSHLLYDRVALVPHVLCDSFQHDCQKVEYPSF